MSTNETTDLTDVAEEPKSMTIDGTTVTGHSIPDRIQAERFEATKGAAKKRRFPIQAARIVPGGPTE